MDSRNGKVWQFVGLAILGIVITWYALILTGRWLGVTHSARRLVEPRMVQQRVESELFGAIANKPLSVDEVRTEMARMWREESGIFGRWTYVVEGEGTAWVVTLRADRPPVWAAPLWERIVFLDLQRLHWLPRTIDANQLHERMAQTTKPGR